MLKSFSVIVPVMNKEHAILRTLESVEASIQYFDQQHQGESVEAEIVVVNEGSTDRTPAIIQAFSQTHPHCKIVHHFKRTSAGTARNVGANAAKGDLLFFCDGDDLYFKEHIYLCFRLLNHDPTTNPATSFTLQREQGDQTIQLPNQAIGVVRTAVYMADDILPFWKVAIENSIPQNICIRRDCHEFVEGFPEQKIPYNETGCEDISYQLFISKFFKIVKVNLETVEYIRYPGNNFDRQLKKFQTPPEHHQEEMPSEMRELHLIRHQIEQNHVQYLLEKFKRMDKSQEFLSVLNWQQMSNDYMSQNQFEAAIPLLETWLSGEPHNGTACNFLAAAYNNLGSAVRTRGDLLQATTYYQKALALNPSFSISDLAKVNLNIAFTLRDRQQPIDALIYLQKALELDPNLPEAIVEISRLKYQAHIVQRGYEFTEVHPDLFANWEKFLSKFTNLPDFKGLEIGCQDGESTCWLLDNILLHPAARMTCIDTVSNQVEERTAQSYLSTIAQQFEANIAKTGASAKVRKVAGIAQIVLRSLIPNSFDLVHVNDALVAADLLENILICWRLVKVGGIIILANYDVQASKKSVTIQPKAAIDAFLSVFSPKVRVLHQERQVLVEKTAE